MLNTMIMKIMEIKLLKLLASFILILSFFTKNAFAEVKESRALVVASLIQFDCSLYEAQKDVVSANANSALIKMESDEQMLQMRTIGKYDLELSKSEYEKAKAELLIAELNLKRCKISAPFDGAVEEILVNTFETIQPQVELMKIIQTDVLELEMVVSSEWISWLTIGHPIVVYIDEIQKEFNATVSGIGANVDPVSQTIQLKGTITDASPALLAGMSGRVLF